ncbi:hypothetical protein [Methylobacterium radiotolerans]|uniref:hypothetical protein n=1 Tax=Methylobacterium radiotolerans TaxID=31998 RepID=UPI0011155543|nr:hypothetical protein [Methylobacterium radiotolerans]
MSFSHPAIFMLGVLALMANGASAREFICSNQDLEISCNKGKCEQSGKGNFTPASASVDINTRQLSICMYSMCLEGKADQLLVSREFIIARGEQLKSNSGQGARGSGVVVIDIVEKSGVMVAMNFRNPLVCEAR